MVYCLDMYTVYKSINFYSYSFTLSDSRIDGICVCHFAYLYGWLYPYL